MADAFIIETATITAGIVAAQGEGFRFYASHPSVLALDGKVFGSPKAAQRAAERLIQSPQKSAASKGESR